MYFRNIKENCINYSYIHTNEYKIGEGSILNYHLKQHDVKSYTVCTCCEIFVRCYYFRHVK